ncbi:MAG: AraC family transcriptional regulator [Dehalococcoidales bacterium]
MSSKGAKLEDNHIIQNALDIIDNRITERIAPQELAKECGYSAFHFNRIFSRATGITLMAYVTRRKLQYALFDLSCEEKFIDVAVKYGFETHAGFTKAFKKCFGYPPSIYRIHAISNQPTRMELTELISIISGGNIMYPEIIEMQPFLVVGFTSRHTMPNVKSTHDIPLYWETINMDCAEPLTRLHNVFNKSKHCEYTVCFDINPLTSEFTYLLGVGVDNPEDLARIEPDMYKMKMPGGLYAKFTTPLAEDPKHSQDVRDTWKNVFDNWLPASKYVFDEKRYDFEYYDLRDHPWENNGMSQMDIFIPIQKR